MGKYSDRPPGAIRRYAHREAEIRDFVTKHLADSYTFEQVRGLLEQRGVSVTAKTLYNWCAKWRREATAGTPDAE